MNSDDLSLNIETVNLDTELEFETFYNNGVADGFIAESDEQPFRNSSFALVGGDQLNTDINSGNKNRENDDIVTRIMNSINPVKWEFLKGHFDVTTEEIKERIKGILRNAYSKENIFRNMNTFILNSKANSSFGGGFGFKSSPFGGTGGFVSGIQVNEDTGDGFELFYCKNLDQQKKSDMYGPFWLNVTLSLLIGMYSTLLPQIKSKYILNPDVAKFNFSFSFIFTSMLITCSSIYGLLLYLNEYTPLSLLFTIFGYGNITLFPGIFGIMLFNNNLVSWTLMFICSLFNMMFLYNSLVINGNKRHTHTIVIAIMLSSLIQTILLKLLFF